MAGLRIIPARAGFTPGSRRRCSSCWDHPRSRGVHPMGTWTMSGRAGSSPLARGSRTLGGGHEALRRIIPARAGFTHREPASARRRPDHPRSRGVHVGTLTVYRLPSGSSPLARGSPAAGQVRGPGSGIIPARAGFTHGIQLCVGHVWDHPRSRGVHKVKSKPCTALAGSSPLARGSPFHHWTEWGPDRIIPARAGFTVRTLCA